MSDPLFDVDWLCEEAALLWLGATVPGLAALDAAVTRRHFEEGLRKEDPDTLQLVWNLRTLPCVVAEAASLQQIDPNVGIWRMQLDLTLLAAADTTDTAYRTYQRQLETRIHQSDLAAKLSAQHPGFHCGGIIDRIPGRKALVGRHFEWTISTLLMGMHKPPA